MKDLHKRLVDTINSLPGIDLNGHNLSHPFNEITSNWGGACLFFYSDEKDTEGLFFIIRSMDARYWEYGHLWRIEITVGDQIHPNGDRPITYNIYRPFISKETEEELDKEIESLIDNMKYHFNHDGFMSGFNMNRKKYGLKDWLRQMKLKDLGI